MHMELLTKRAMKNTRKPTRAHRIQEYTLSNILQMHTHAHVPKIPIQHSRAPAEPTGNCRGCLDNLVPRKAQKASQTAEKQKRT